MIRPVLHATSPCACHSPGPDSRPSRWPSRVALAVCLTAWAIAATGSAPPAHAAGQARIRPCRLCGRAACDVAEGAVRLRPRRRLLPRQLPAAHRLLAEARRESDRMKLVGHRQDRRGPPHLDGDRHVAGEPQEARPLSGRSRGGSRWPRASPTSRRARWPREGKAVVWIDGGLHATETCSARSSSIETVYQMVSRTDEETLRILDDVVILLRPRQPGRHDLVADWYMRERRPAEAQRSAACRGSTRSTSATTTTATSTRRPQAETENMNRVLYREWFPQIVYNHHQTGPAGTVLFVAAVPRSVQLQLRSAADPTGHRRWSARRCTARFAAEGKPGATMRSGAQLLDVVERRPAHDRVLPQHDRPADRDDRQPDADDDPASCRSGSCRAATCRCPIAPQSVALPPVDRLLGDGQPRRARLRVAVPRARSSSTSTGWAGTRSSAAAGTRGRRAERCEASRPSSACQDGGGARWPRGAAERHAPPMTVLRDPAKRDPRGYIIPSDQPDFPTASKFVNALLKTGVDGAPRDRDVHRRRARRIPAGSFVVKTAQAFRPHVLDMFEPQDHPNDFPYPGRPADAALRQRRLDARDPDGRAVRPHPRGLRRAVRARSRTGTSPARRRSVTGAADARAATCSTARDATTRSSRVNRLLKAGERVRLAARRGGIRAGRRRGQRARRARRRSRAELGVSCARRRRRARRAGAARCAPVRIGLWDQYGGSMPSGWTRWILEQFEFPFERRLSAGARRRQPQREVRRAGLRRRRRFPAPAAAGGRARRGAADATMSRRSTAAAARPRDAPRRRMPQLKAVRRGRRHRDRHRRLGRDLARHLGLPVENTLVENGNAAAGGEVLRARVGAARRGRHHAPARAGMNERDRRLLRQQPGLPLGPRPPRRRASRRSRGSTPTPLRSGWAWGQQYLESGVAIAEAPVGKGPRALRPGDHVPRRRTARSSSSSTGSIAPPEGRGAPEAPAGRTPSRARIVDHAASSPPAHPLALSGPSPSRCRRSHLVRGSRSSMPSVPSRRTRCARRCVRRSLRICTRNR